MPDPSVSLPSFEGPICPLPLPHHEQIVLGHGSGGKMSHDLIRQTFLSAFDNPILRTGDDAAPLEIAAGLLAISTDAHVVSPLFFPGGDIGRLAVCGTVNDVAMLGARPLYLTASFILEEGLSLAGVQIVAGDTKVVEKGKADGMYITTTGIGVRRPGRTIGGAQARPGDVVILSGPIGDHGIAVLSARGELGFESDLQSDVAPLNHLIEVMLDAAPHLHVLRDPTRGGLATTLNEIARQSNCGIVIDEATIPIRPAVLAACEMLGFDPLYVANEGKVVAIVPAEEAEALLQAMRRTRYGEQAVPIGQVTADPPGRVLLRTAIGTTRVLDMLAGEMLPRIC